MKPTVDAVPSNRMALAARSIPWIVAAALLLPLMFASPEAPGKFHLGLPRVLSGDEPHYLVMINSLLLDGDLNLANNYAAVHAGAQQAGRRFAGSPLDHHSVWFRDNKRRNWRSIYETDGRLWRRDAAGRPVPTLRPGQTPPAPGHPEYSTHPPGVAIILAPLLFPFRHTAYVEPLAIFCSTLAMIAAMLLFRGWAQTYCTNRLVVDLVTAVTFLGTPAWYYGRSLYNETFLLLFAVGAYSFALRGKSPLLAGTFIALGMMMKPPFALLVIPLALMYVAARDLRSAAWLILPTVIAFVAILWLNDLLFGAPWRSSQAWRSGSFITGATGVLFSLKYGYLITTPAIIAALAAWPAFMRAHRADAIVVAAAVMLYFGLMADFVSFSGASCYAARYEVPLLPLVFVALVKLPETWLWRTSVGRYVCVAVCVLSIAANGLAAMPYWRLWDSNALLYIIDGKFQQ